MTVAAQTIAESRYHLSHLSDGEVLAGTRRLVGASNQLFADLLAHLAEVEARGIHRTKACASLYTYCIYELQFSEDAAFRRVSAARFVKAFPALLDAVANGELHLTGLLMVAPHLTVGNQHEVLARAKHRTKKELAKLVRELDPLPDVPARIAPLGPAPEPRSPLRNPTWAEYVASMVPVRHLKPGERPRDWVDEPTIANAFDLAASTVERFASTDLASPSSDSSVPDSSVPDSSVPDSSVPNPSMPAADDAPICRSSERAGNGASNLVAQARRATAVTGPQRHSVQFTASQEYADLVEKAKALLSHTGGTSLEELHLRAMQCLVAQLEKRRYGAPRREPRMLIDDEAEQENKTSRPMEANRDPEIAHARNPDEDDTTARSEIAHRNSVSSRQTTNHTQTTNASQALSRETLSSTSEVSGARETVEKDAGAMKPERSRSIPARIRRRVFERDGARCTFTDETGCRCREVERLELHHLKPFALDGGHHADNLTLRCQAHNALAAERDFGPRSMMAKRDATRHASWTATRP